MEYLLWGPVLASSNIHYNIIIVSLAHQLEVIHLQWRVCGISGNGRRNRWVVLIEISFWPVRRRIRVANSGGWCSVCDEIGLSIVQFCNSDVV